MLKQTAILVTIVMILSACGASKQEVMHFNDDLTTINDSLFYKGKVWGEEFRIAFSTGDYSRLPAARAAMVSYIDKSIETVRNTKDVGDSRAFREAELDYLAFERDSILPRMEIFETFTDSTSREDIAAAYKNLLATAHMEQAKQEHLRRVQKEYADKNKIQLKPSSMSLVE